jgi:thiol-disulfide isomerase/thioredoxin
MDSEPPRNDLRSKVIGLAALVVAALVAVAVVGYVVAGGSDDGPSTADDANPTEPGAALDPSSPTPLPDTGVLDPERPEVGQPAPNFALADVRDTGLVRQLTDFRGTPIVLNWYASWCGPCKAEIPTFQQAQDELGDGVVVFFGVNLLESQSKALGILEELEATYPAVRDTNGEVSDHYRVTAMPTTFFIDADGVLVAEHLGPINEEQLIELLAEIGVEWEPGDAG